MAELQTASIRNVGLVYRHVCSTSDEEMAMIEKDIDANMKAVGAFAQQVKDAIQDERLKVQMNDAIAYRGKNGEARRRSSS
jgi:hypothetical protein